MRIAHLTRSIDATLTVAAVVAVVTTVADVAAVVAATLIVIRQKEKISVNRDSHEK